MLNSPEKKLEQEVNEYVKVGKENPNVDVGTLMLHALQNQHQNIVPSKTKRWAYLISIGVPPFGILFALKYFFSDEDDARDVAWICVILTVISLILIFIMGKMFFSSAGVSPQQIEQIKPSDAMQLLQ